MKKNHKALPLFNIWTDGACRVHTDKLGSWAFTIVDRDNTILHTQSGYKQHTTSPAMELTAVVKAVDYALQILPHGEIIVHSDSEVVTKGITEWIHSWKKNSWRTSSGKSVRNKPLWKHLDHLTEVVDVNFKWVKGHAGTKYNEMVDKMCTAALKRYDNKRKKNTN
jgi:ribonuclease HI